MAVCKWQQKTILYWLWRSGKNKLPLTKFRFQLWGSRWWGGGTEVGYSWLELEQPGSACLCSLLLGCLAFLLIGSTPTQLFPERREIFPKMSKSLEFELTKDTSVFWVLLGERKCRNITCWDTERLLCCCFLILSQVSEWQRSQFGLLAITANHFKLYRSMFSFANILPSATVILCEAFIFMDTDADLSLKTEGKRTQSGSDFSIQGRISLSKCLAGKYVTGLENDTVVNR